MTAEEVIALGLDAIGDQVQKLASGDVRLDTYEGKLLCEYVKAACAVSRNAREADLHDKVHELGDADLERLIADEARNNPALLKRIIERAKADAGRAS